MHRPVRALLTITAAAVAAAVTLPAAPALAGSYTVSACSPQTSPGVWVQTNTDPAGFTTGQACGGPAIGPLAGGDQGALSAEDILNSPAQIPNGSLAGWTFTAPPATTITAISYYRELSSYVTSDLVAGLFQASGAPLEQCMIPWPFVNGSSITCSMPNTQAPVTFTGLNTTSLFFGVVCRIVDGAAACIDGGAPAHAAQADLYSASVTLSQSVPPTLTLLGGALWEGGVTGGVVLVTFAASDPSGIAHAVVRSDTGATVGSADQACDFTRAPPCPQLPAGVVGVDTTQVPDGPRTFSLTVTDAAGNTQTATSPSVVVDNQGPPAPVAFTATAQSPTSNAISLAWRNPAAPAVPVTGAMLQLCQAACAVAIAVSPSGAAQITAPAAGTYTLRLWLLDAQGRGGPQHAAVAGVTVPSPTKTGDGSGGAPNTVATGLRTRVTATIKGRRMRVTATLASIAHGAVKVSWRSRSFGRTLGSSSRTVTTHNHTVTLNFTLAHKARTGAVRVAVRSGRRILASTLARTA